MAGKVYKIRSHLCVYLRETDLWVTIRLPKQGPRGTYRLETIVLGSHKSKEIACGICPGIERGLPIEDLKKVTEWEYSGRRKRCATVLEDLAAR